MKTKLTFAPILTLQGGIDGFIVYCDTSEIGLRSVLMRHEIVVSYASRQLKNHDKNYFTHNLELAAMVLSRGSFRKNETKQGNLYESEE